VISAREGAFGARPPPRAGPRPGPRPGDPSRTSARSARSAALRAGLLPALFALAAATSTRPAQGRARRAEGTVHDSLAGAPLPGAEVRALLPGGRLAGRALSDGAGRFRIHGLEEGSYVVEALRPGYRRARLEGVRIGGTGAAALRLALAPEAWSLDPVVVTVSRNPEPSLDAPASVSVVERRAVEGTFALTPLDPVRQAPGVDFASKGLVQHTFAVRGARSANSGAVLLLADHRRAAVPSLGFNVSYLLPPAVEDVERIEVTRGPGAALYGPNAHQGVVHVVTRSPLDSPGTAVSLLGGGRSVQGVSGRHASRLGDRVGAKVSASWMRGEDWAFTDSVEAVNRARALLAGADPDTLRIGSRDPDVERLSADARVDWRGPDGAILVGAVGQARALRLVDLTADAGAIQVRDWHDSYASVRLERRRLNAQVSYHLTDAGDTYLLRTGARVRDDSRFFAAQVQHGLVAGGRHLLIAGADLQRTDPRTHGTIHGRHERDDRVTEIGAYVQETAALTARWDLIVALRADYHDRLRDAAVSPRAAAVFRPGAAHALRLSYNRGFNSPDASDLFVDLVVDSLAGAYAIRRLGIPRDGYALATDCEGPCMFSPFNPASAGGAGAALPAEATRLWPAAVAALAEGGLDLAGVPAPGPDDVGTRLAVLDPAAGVLRDAPPAPGGLPPLGRTTTSAFELGYRSVLADRLSLALELHRTRTSDLPGPLVVATPSVFLDRASLERYLAGFLPADVAARAAESAAGLPLGTVGSRALPGPDLLVFRAPGGHSTVWGADLAVSVALSRLVSAEATYSWLSDDEFPGVGGAERHVLNVPRSKGAVAVELHDVARGLEGGVRVRAVSSFAVESGVYRGRVAGYTIVDADVGWRLPWARRVRLGLGLENLLDHRHREFVGVPELGRLLLARVRTEM
jgi:iron complex outermembrane receptor protein